MRPVNMHEAKTQVSRLVQAIPTAEKVMIARAGTPLVKLVPVGRDMRPRWSGRFKGMIRMAPDFDRTPEGIIAAVD